MTAIYINPETNDFSVVAGRMRLTSTLSEQVRQDLVTRLRWFLGEWFADLALGVPYFRDVLVRRPDLPAIRTTFSRVILQTTGVQALKDFLMSLDGAERTLAISFQVQVSDGTELDVAFAYPLVSFDSGGAALGEGDE